MNKLKILNDVNMMYSWEELKPLVVPTEKQAGHGWVMRKLNELHKDGWDDRDDDNTIPAIFWTKL